MIRPRQAFTLIELLVVVAIIAVLAILIFSVGPAIIKRSQVAKSSNNMRQVGAAFIMFAGDNDFDLPGRVRGNSNRWPYLLNTYLGDKTVYADPSDPTNYIVMHRDPLSNARNATSYIMNGYNDLGAFRNQSVTVKINTIDDPTNTILLGNQTNKGHFYMDSDAGDQNSVLNKTSFSNGSNYLFADGSVRFIKKVDYRDDLWLVHKPVQQ